MKLRSLLIAAACLLGPVAVFAQTDEELEFFRIRLDTLLDDFYDDTKIDQFALTDVDGDGHTDLVLASNDLRRTTVYSSAREDSSQQPLALTQEMTDKLKDPNQTFYQPVSYLRQSLGEDSRDHLTRLAPRFAWSAGWSDDYASNYFSYSTSTEDLEADTQRDRYDRLVFKHHVGKVHHTGVDMPENEHYDASPVWMLDNPEDIKTMFRGYKPGEVSPILFKAGFEQEINLLKFSRWKAPEPVKTVSDDVKSIILSYYRNEKIAGIRYVADCTDNERIWYRVVFTPRNRIAHYALVCIAEGSVASVWDEYDDLDEFGAGPSDVWYGGSLKEFWNWKGIEFMAMWGSPAGLEIAVRWNSMEGTHYSILREYGAKMQLVFDDYEYLQAY